MRHSYHDPLLNLTRSCMTTHSKRRRSGWSAARWDSSWIKSLDHIRLNQLAVTSLNLCPMSSSLFLCRWDLCLTFLWKVPWSISYFIPFEPLIILVYARCSCLALLVTCLSTLSCSRQHFHHNPQEEQDQVSKEVRDSHPMKTTTPFVVRINLRPLSLSLLPRYKPIPAKNSREPSPYSPLYPATRQGLLQASIS